MRKPVAPTTKRAGSGKKMDGPGNRQAAANRPFNDGLGDKLKAAIIPPEKDCRGLRIMLAVAIALAAAGLFLAANLSIGS